MKLVYEAQTCSRCAGTGHHSYNQIHGTVCFGCNGRGEKDTKRGSATRAFMNELLVVSVSELAAGDIFSMPPQKGLYTIKSISDPVKSGWSQAGDGPKIDSYRVTITTIKDITFGVSASGTVRRMATAEDIEAGVEYQDNLTKAGTVRKRRKVT